MRAQRNSVSKKGPPVIMTSGGIFLDIRNNANLKQLTWKQDPTFSNNQKPTTVYIYNNPLMDDKTLDLVKRVITNDGTITSIIQGKSGG